MVQRPITSSVKVALVVATMVCLQHCGSPPPTMPTTYTGSLRISAMDTASIKWFFLHLDDVNYDRCPNPYILDNVVIGVHKLLVFDYNNAGLSQMVEVYRDQTTDVSVSLLAGGPYLGMIAPSFVAKTIDDQTIDLGVEKGKVILLAFFEHT
jgi:hypothetical protein